MDVVAVYGNNDKANRLSKQLNLPLIDSTSHPFPYILHYQDDYLQLQSVKNKNFKPLYIDFTTGKARHRRIFPGKELLIKAIVGKKKKDFTIIDATAGLGRDSFVLASMGYNVTLIERKPILVALLQDGLQRAKIEPQLQTIINRMHLTMGNAQHVLPNLKAHVIYLDPMYPSCNKNALVKKEMRILRDIVGDDNDAANLLVIALQCASERVVVKRPKHAKNLNGQPPSFSLTGRSSRFDVYLTGVNDVSIENER